MFTLKGKTFEEISTLSSPDENSLCFGKLLIDETGKLLFNFGKYSGQTIENIITTDSQYIKWIIEESSMDNAIKYYILAEYNKLKKNKT